MAVGETEMGGVRPAVGFRAFLGEMEVESQEWKELQQIQRDC